MISKHIALLLFASAPLGAQLRHAVASADLVVVATDVSVRPAPAGFLAHLLRPAETLKGEPPQQITVLEQKGVSRHAQPVPGERRLYCLLDFTAEAQRLGLPAGSGRCYKLCGQEGSSPQVGTDLERDPHVALARAVVAADRGLEIQAVTDRVAALLLSEDRKVRLEAVALLTERPALQSKLTPTQRSDLMLRAVGELEDVPLKIALAELCGEMRMPRLVEELCRAAETVEDRRFYEALGRIAKALHGDAAHEPLLPALRAARSPATKDRLLLALGATSTDGALNVLLDAARRQTERNPWLDAALEIHGAKQAREALARRADSRPDSDGARR